MPKIPVTRKILLKKPDQDHIQWTLTNHNEGIKRYHYPTKPSTKDITTIDVAKKFVKLVNNTNNKQEKINDIVKDIKYLYNIVSFSTKTFTEYALEHVSNTTSLLVTYYEVSEQLDILALSTRSILNHVPKIEELLCELFYYHDKVAEVYVQALDEKTLHRIFELDGKQFLNWSGLMKAENIQRLLCTLKHYTKIMKTEQCLNLLMQFQTLATENINKLNFKLIQRVKEFIFTPNKMSTKQSDTLIAKTPVLRFLSTWFFEFEYNSILKLSEYTLNLIFSNSETNENIPDISLLLYIYNVGCRQLSIEGKDVIRITDLVEMLNNAAIKSLEHESSAALAVTLTFAQLTFEQMHQSVGYTYHSWFQTTFFHSKTSILNKKSSTIFIDTLQKLVHYELPSILQIHARALQGSSSIPYADTYISSVKKRLLELGMDSTFKKYPQSIKMPVQASIAVPEDDIPDILHQFVKRGEVVPHSLLSASVFRRVWFTSTFLPKLLSWNEKSDIKVRDKLIESLRKDKKIPDAMYYDFIQKKK